MIVPLKPLAAIFSDCCQRLSHGLRKSLVVGSEQSAQTEVVLVVEDSELVSRHQTAIQAVAEARGILV